MISLLTTSTIPAARSSSRRRACLQLRSVPNGLVAVSKVYTPGNRSQLARGGSSVKVTATPARHGPAGIAYAALGVTLMVATATPGFAQAHCACWGHESAWLGVTSTRQAYLVLRAVSALLLLIGMRNAWSAAIDVVRRNSK